jgi:hypothetical protein
MESENHGTGELSPEQEVIAAQVQRIYASMVAEGRTNPHELLLLGQTCVAAELFKQGREYLGRCVEADISNAFAWHCLGLCCQELGDLEPAIEALEKALQLEPSLREARFKLGVTYHQKGCLDEALACYSMLASEDLGHAKARFNASLIHLLKKNYALGWPEYEQRWDENPRMPRLFQREAPWLGGTSIEYKRVLLYAEQGLGDTLFFLRYVPLIRNQGALVILEVQPELAKLAKLSFPQARVFARGEPLPEHDENCPLGSLPLACLSGIDRPIPNQVPYLKAPSPQAPQRTNASRKRVGLVWSGNPSLNINAQRSIPFGLVRKILDASDFDFVSLQKPSAHGPKAPTSGDARLETWPLGDADFADTAALIESLDLVISVDTAVAHLAGALGKPVWIMLPFVPDWRWGLQGESCDWYPSARLFRQEKRGDWAPVVERVRTTLAELR